MNAEIYRDWVEYYGKRGDSGRDRKYMSGYSHALAQMTERGLVYLTNKIATLLDLKPVDRLLDMGCGAGLITDRLIDKVDFLVGLDANLSMIRHVSGSIRRIVGSADMPPFSDGTFNKVLCHSVIHLFPSHEYAAKAIFEMKRVMKDYSRILIMDVPDIAKKEDYEKVKPSEDHNLHRLFYDREWFEQVLPGAQIIDLTIPDYLNSQFRFTVLFRS